MDLILKHSLAQGVPPAPEQIGNGELAINHHSSSPRLYIKDSAGNIVPIAGPYSTVDYGAVIPGTGQGGSLFLEDPAGPGESPILYGWDGTAMVPLLVKVDDATLAYQGNVLVVDTIDEGTF